MEVRGDDGGRPNSVGTNLVFSCRSLFQQHVLGLSTHFKYAKEWKKIRWTSFSVLAPYAQLRERHDTYATQKPRLSVRVRFTSSQPPPPIARRFHAASSYN